MIFQLDTVIKAYTEGKTKLSITGRIPIKEFDSMEADLRPQMRARGLRVWYRGPRPQLWCATTTRRANATHAVIYTK
jgi:hypothetical protein